MVRLKKTKGISKEKVDPLKPLYTYKHGLAGELWKLGCSDVCILVLETTQSFGHHLLVPQTLLTLLLLAAII